jgi:hypothetical protein
MGNLLSGCEDDDALASRLAGMGLSQEESSHVLQQYVLTQRPFFVYLHYFGCVLSAALFVASLVSSVCYPSTHLPVLLSWLFDSADTRN